MDGKELQLEGVGVSVCFFYPHSHSHMVKHSKPVLSFGMSHCDDMVLGYNTPYTDSTHGRTTIAMGQETNNNYKLAPSVFICLVSVGTTTSPDLSFK